MIFKGRDTFRYRWRGFREGNRSLRQDTREEEKDTWPARKPGDWTDRRRQNGTFPMVALRVARGRGKKKGKGLYELDEGKTAL